MAALTIRQLDDSLKARLRVRAAHHGRSMEAEVREILKSALAQDDPPTLNLAQSIRRHMDPFGGVELNIPPRMLPRRPPKSAK